jgi:hypothetical protein
MTLLSMPMIKNLKEAIWGVKTKLDKIIEVTNSKFKLFLYE